PMHFCCSSIDNIKAFIFRSNKKSFVFVNANFNNFVLSFSDFFSLYMVENNSTNIIFKFWKFASVIYIPITYHSAFCLLIIFWIFDNKPLVISQFFVVKLFV